jgi:hypothetical protein
LTSRNRRYLPPPYHVLAALAPHGAERTVSGYHSYAIPAANGLSQRATAPSFQVRSGRSTSSRHASIRDFKSCSRACNPKRLESTLTSSRCADPSQPLPFAAVGPHNRFTLTSRHSATTDLVGGEPSHGIFDGGAAFVSRKSWGIVFQHPALCSTCPGGGAPKGGFHEAATGKAIPVTVPRASRKAIAWESLRARSTAKLRFAFDVAGSRMNNTEIFDRYTASYAAHNNSWRCTCSCDLISCIC